MNGSLHTVVDCISFQLMLGQFWYNEIFMLTLILISADLTLEMGSVPLCLATIQNFKYLQYATHRSQGISTINMPLSCNGFS